MSMPRMTSPAVAVPGRNGTSAAMAAQRSPLSASRRSADPTPTRSATDHATSGTARGEAPRTSTTALVRTTHS